MAGAMPIMLTKQEVDLIQRMRVMDLIRFLTELDEHGWMMARAVLAELASRSTKPKPKNTEEPNERR
jgi:hypothetical protein